MLDSSKDFFCSWVILYYCWGSAVFITYMIHIALMGQIINLMIVFEMGGVVIYFVVLDKHLTHTSLEPRPHTPVKKIITKRKMHNIPLNNKDELSNEFLLDCDLLYI